MVFRIFSIERTSRGLEKSTVFEAATIEEARKQQDRARKALGGQIEIEEVKPGERVFITAQVIPGSARLDERGLELQQRRQQLEKIQRKVGVTAEGKIDISKLTRAQKARVRQITGVTAEKAFTVEQQKPTTRLESKQRATALGERIDITKVKQITPTKRRGFVTSLFERQGFQVIERGAGVSAVKPGVQVITTPTDILTARGPVTGEGLKFQPVFKEQLGTGVPKTGVSLAIFKVTKEAQVLGRRIKEKAAPLVPLAFTKVLKIREELSRESIELLKKQIKESKGIRKTLLQGRLLRASAGEGAIKLVTEKPLTVGTFFVGGGAFSLLGRAAAATRITRVGFRVGATGLTAAAVGVTGFQVTKAPTVAKKGELIGEAGVEFGAFIGGAKAGRLIAGAPGAIKVKVREVKFERGIKAFEKRITEKDVDFDPTREIFEPTGVRTVDIPTGRTIIETAAIRRGFPVFGRAGEITGRQLQLKPEFKPGVEAQAEFISPALGVGRVARPRDVFLGKFVERPLTPLQQAVAREPPRVLRKVPERQKTLGEFQGIRGVPTSKFFSITFKKPKPSRFAGEVFQIGGLIPPIAIPKETPFERFGGEFFERAPREARKVPRPKVEVTRRVRPPRVLDILKPTKAITLQEQRLLSGARLEVAQRPIARLKVAQLQKPIISQDVSLIIDLKPIVSQKPKVKLDVALTPITIQRPILEVAPITIPIPKSRPITKPKPIPKLKQLPDRPIIIPLPKQKRQGISKKAFTTEVREGQRKRDRFIQTTGKALPRLRAINKGARIVDNTTARSFRIKRKGTTTLREDRKFFRKDKFRRRKGKTKLPKRTFVEKSKFAIDSFGERAGIPFSPSRIPRLREALARKQQTRTIRTPRTIRRFL